MADRIEITAEDIANAKTYLPLATKELLARTIAAFCVEPVEVRVGMDDGILSLPLRARENRKLRQQYQMGILAHYLNKEYKEQEAKVSETGETMTLAFCMDEGECDAWCESHVMNQLERLKKAKDDHATSNRIFDLLYDYKATETMLSLAIRDELDARNDTFGRVMEFVVTTMAEDQMKEIIEGKREELQKVAEEAEKYAKERKETGNG